MHSVAPARSGAATAAAATIRPALRAAATINDRPSTSAVHCGLSRRSWSCVRRVNEPAIKINRLHDRWRRRRSARRRDAGPPRRSARAVPARPPASQSPQPAPARRRTGTSRPVSSGAHDLAAARHVGRHHRAAAGGGLEQDFGRPSRRDGSTAMWARAQRSAMSRDVPKPGDAGLAVPGRRPRVRLTEAGLAGSGVPAISSSTSEPRRRSSRCASISVRMPLSSSSRPTKATVGGPERLRRRLQALDVDAGTGDRARCVRLQCRARAGSRGRRGSAPARRCPAARQPVEQHADQARATRARAGCCEMKAWPKPVSALTRRARPADGGERAEHGGSAARRDG